MSTLTKGLPEHLIIRGVKCPIRTDFKTWLIFSQLISDTSEINKNLAQIFKLVFYELPPNFYDAINEMMKFYTGEEPNKKNGEKTERKKMFDFEYDSDLIYSAFVQQYKIDLYDVDLHWWKFKSLFANLTEDTNFVKVVQYRGMDISKIKDKEQKKFYQKMKRFYKLPDNRSEEQKEVDFAKTIEKMFV